MRLLDIPLTGHGDSLESFVETANFSAILKDAKTTRYIACSEVVSALFGLTPALYAGLAPDDIRHRIHSSNIPELKKGIDMDHRIIASVSEGVQYKRVWFKPKEYISVEEVIKRPVLGSHNQVKAVLTYGTDITAYASLSYLFALHEARYVVKKIAIRQFLKQVNLAHFFISPPTRRELNVLLAMQKTSNAKYIGRALHLSHRTIDANKGRLSDKLRDINLEALLMYLRMRSEHNSFIKDEIKRL